MAYERIPLEDFPTVFQTTSTEISSVALGGSIVAVSDEFFAEAFHLLKVEPAPSLKGQFGPKGSLFSGWETRRHNPTYDWCIIKLGCPGKIVGFDIDTAHFNGNEAPQASVQGLFTTSNEILTESEERWTEILPIVDLGPSSRHLFRIPLTEKPYTHVKLNMYPDGGIARFRVYGLVSAVFPDDSEILLDLASVMSGGRVVYTSDAHFGAGSNLLLPGRGKDMSDGWETRRSRTKDHKDSVIVELGAIGRLEYAEVDTIHFMGNFPESCTLHAMLVKTITPTGGSDQWVEILPRTKLGPHRQHVFQLQNVDGQLYSHVRLTMYPDGGIKRLRIMGRRSTADVSHTTGETGPFLSSVASIPSGTTPAPASGQVRSTTNANRIIALPLTREAFAPFGDVLMAWADPNAAPKGIRVTTANQGTAMKFHGLSDIKSSYPTDSGAVTGISVFRSTPVGAVFGSDWEVKLLERHPHTNQAFIPMGTASLPGYGEVSLPPNRGYLVIVALNGKDDRPDLTTLQAFVATTAQGIMYKEAVWHHPMISLESPIDFACVETQIGTPNHPLDCELLHYEDDNDTVIVHVPNFN